jgi:hypothetical protein
MDFNTNDGERTETKMSTAAAAMFIRRMISITRGKSVLSSSIAFVDPPVGIVVPLLEVIISALL